MDLVPSADSQNNDDQTEQCVVPVPSMEALGTADVDSEDDEFDEAEKAPPRLPSAYRAKPSVIEFSPVSDNGDNSLKVTEEIYDPCNLSPRGLLNTGISALIESLKFDVLELHIEGFETTVFEVFSPAECFAVLFSEGAVPGTWEVTGKSEAVRCSPHIKLVKKFRLRAATELDRSEKIVIAFFNSSTPSHLLSPSRALGYEVFSASELIEAKRLTLKRRLRNDRWNFWGNAQVVLSLDVIKHVSKKEMITIEFGLTSDAPRRNRMFFVLSRGLPQGTWSPIYKSEVRTRDDMASFNAVCLECLDFHGGDESKNFRLELHRWYKNGRTRPLGFIQTSLEKLKTMHASTYLYWWPADDGITSAKVTLVRALASPSECRFQFSLTSS
ncbi:hypothetical protein BWQ96_08608 [Gracilariopsis chorda]|uniref:Uncharacterized protein n=1 Tax=Gracilariopsis chorda TaxID=448386 RepID=A0A2V3IHX9_9FLOR|nr:hypothetical protein BWQ96_08608 [Gracilariopsis chorda]|eukprot:PXF41687.1 hypothetical protein BWQ96_08608 [Gracilariopsis chorda]